MEPYLEIFLGDFQRTLLIIMPNFWHLLMISVPHFHHGNLLEVYKLSTTPLLIDTCRVTLKQI